MIDLNGFHKIASTIKEAIIYYSCGSDSTVMLDAFNQIKLKNATFIHLYYIKGLSFRENLIKYYEDKYKIKIYQEPHWEINYMLKKEGRKYNKMTFTQHMNGIRKKYGIEYVAYGYIKGESMARNIMIKKDYIDDKYKKLYPLKNWNKQDVLNYIKRRKLLLSPECGYGFANIDQFKGEAVEWLKVKYPEDYDRAVKQYPCIEIDYNRFKMYGK